MSAAGALIEMTAQCGGTTPGNGQQYFDMLPADPLAIALDEGSSRGADEIGHLQGWPVQLVPQLERVQRTRSRVEVPLGEVQVDGGLFQIVMA